jgi:hypothetical protein
MPEKKKLEKKYTYFEDAKRSWSSLLPFSEDSHFLKTFIFSFLGFWFPGSGPRLWFRIHNTHFLEADFSIQRMRSSLVADEI